jgi:MFS family permease
MLRTQLILLLISAATALATALDAVTIGVLYAVAVAASVASAFDGPARQALIPQLVPRDQLGAATSLNMLAMSTARMVGPAIGGLAVAWLGVAAAYALDALSFLAVIGALLAMQTAIGRPNVRVSGVAAVIEGLQFIWRTPVIGGVMLIDFLATLLGSTVGLAPVFAEDVLKIGPQGMGLLLSAPAAGSMLGGFGLSFLPLPQKPGRTLVMAVVAYGACLALFGLSTSLVLALLCLAGAGAADAVSVAMRHTVRQLATPDELRGRVAATHSALAMGGPRLGEVQSGMSAALLGPRAAMVAGGLACALIAVVVARLIPAVGRYRFDDAPDDEPSLVTAPSGAARKAIGD